MKIAIGTINLTAEQLRLVNFALGEDYGPKATREQVRTLARIEIREALEDQLSRLHDPDDRDYSDGREGDE